MPPKGSKTKKRTTVSNTAGSGRKRKQRDEEEDEKPADTWCWCKKSQGGENMLACDNCQEWYHQSCLGLSDAEFTKKQAESIWTCPDCADEPRPTPIKRGKPARREPEPEPDDEPEEEHENKPQQPRAEEEHEASEPEEPQEEEDERQQANAQQNRIEYQQAPVQVKVSNRNGASTGAVGYPAREVVPVAHTPHEPFIASSVPVAPGSTSPPAPSPFAGYGGTATSPAAVQASMQAICATPGCTSDARMGPCPMCVQMGLPPTFFCSQDCFDRGWATHCATAHLQRVGIPMATKPPAAPTPPPSAQPNPTPIQPTASSPTGATSQPPSPQAVMSVSSQPSVGPPANQQQQQHPHNYPPQHQQQPHHGQIQGYAYPPTYPYPPQQYPPPPPQYSHQSYPNHPPQHLSHPNSMHPTHQLQPQHQQHPSHYPPHQYQQQQTRPMAPGYANYPLQHTAPYPYSGSAGHMPTQQMPQSYPYSHVKPAMNAVPVGMNPQDPSAYPSGYVMPGTTPGFETSTGSETHTDTSLQSEAPVSMDQSVSSQAAPQEPSIQENPGTEPQPPVETAETPAPVENAQVSVSVS